MWACGTLPSKVTKCYFARGVDTQLIIKYVGCGTLPSKVTKCYFSRGVDTQLIIKYVGVWWNGRHASLRN